MLTIKLSTPKTTVDKERVKAILAANPTFTAEQVLAYALEHYPKDVQRVKGGTVCVYGLNTRFPLALWPNQWKELAPYMPAILQFIEAGEKNGSIAEREETVDFVTADTRVPLARIEPVVAAIMASKGVDVAEATRIAKSSGFLK